jgi:hypothetical protein
MHTVVVRTHRCNITQIPQKATRDCYYYIQLPMYICFDVTDPYIYRYVAASSDALSEGYRVSSCISKLVFYCIVSVIRSNYSRILLIMSCFMLILRWHVDAVKSSWA